MSRPTRIAAAFCLALAAMVPLQGQGGKELREIVQKCLDARERRDAKAVEAGEVGEVASSTESEFASVPVTTDSRSFRHSPEETS